MDERHRCVAVVPGGGRSYTARRCSRKAVPGDPEQLCQDHRMVQEGRSESPEEYADWQAERRQEERLTGVAENLWEFYRLATQVECEVDKPGRPPTGRLLVDAADLLRVLGAEDLMPPA